MKSWYLTVVVSSWVLLALIALFFPPARFGVLNVATSAVALLGTAAALSFLVSRRSVYFSVCTGAGLALLVFFALRLGWFVHAYRAADPQTSALIAAWMFIDTRLVVVPAKLATDGFVLRALVEFYWGIGMPLVQLGTVVYAIVRLRNCLGYSGRVSVQNAKTPAIALLLLLFLLMLLIMAVGCVLFPRAVQRFAVKGAGMGVTSRSRTLKAYVESGRNLTNIRAAGFIALAMFLFILFAVLRGH